MKLQKTLKKKLRNFKRQYSIDWKMSAIITMAFIIGSFMFAYEPITQVLYEYREGPPTIYWTLPTTSPTTTTPTTPPTTTTTPVETRRYVFMAMWDFVPIMDTDGPDWLFLQVTWYEGSEFQNDFRYLYDEKPQHYIGVVGVPEYTEARIYISCPNYSGWDLELNGDDYQPAIASSNTYTWNLVNSYDGYDWGDFWFEWILI